MHPVSMHDKNHRQEVSSSIKIISLFISVANTSSGSALIFFAFFHEIQKVEIFMIGYEKSTPSFGSVQRKLCPIAQGVSGFCNRASEVFFTKF